ncbi:MAG TPA: tetratricopeptide repeat protein, partial [Phytomonospora sp.]
SRSMIAELPVTRLPVEPLTLQASVEVLARLAPAAGPSADSSEMRLIAARCAGLPLALALAAARLTVDGSADSLARELGRDDDRVDAFHSGQIGLRNSLESAYRGLSPTAQAALRRLAVLPARDFPGWAGEVAVGLDAARTATVLAELASAHMITPTVRFGGQPRYQLHELVRLFARAKADEVDEDVAEDVIVQWIHLAEDGARPRSARPLGSRVLGLRPPVRPQPGSIKDAWAWFDAEHRSLMDVLRHYAERGDLPVAIAVLMTLAPYFGARHLIDEWRQSIEILRAAADRGDDVFAQACAIESEVRLDAMLADFAGAIPSAERGLSLFERCGHRGGRATMLYHLQYLHQRTGSVDQALAILRDLFSDPVELAALGLLEGVHQALGLISRDHLDDLDSAAYHFDQVRQLVSGGPTSREFAAATFSLGSVRVRQGRHAEAEQLLDQALRLVRADRDRLATALVLTQISEVRPPESAAERLTEALTIAQEIGHRDVEARVREASARLAERRGRLDEAEAELRAGVGLYRALGAAAAVTRLEGELARIRTAA